MANERDALSPAPEALSPQPAAPTADERDRAVGLEWRMPAGLTSSARDMRRSYLRVVVVWAATLLGLYVLQQYFS